jgi:hypothetical protein
VLARRNDRDLPIGGRQWVKNGDRFTVLAITNDCGLQVRHTSGRRLTLPAGYVAEHLQLGYAATIHLAQGTTVETTHTVLTGRESREQLYVALSRGRQANHVHLVAVLADDDTAHPALTPAERGRSDPLDMLRDVLGRSDQRPSATTAANESTDSNRRLAAAVQRYLDAHALHTAATRGSDRIPQASGRPLPWLPPPPDPDESGAKDLAEYVQRRADLVYVLAVGITADHLPNTPWVKRLRGADPDLARELAVWRAATGIADHPAPFGPAGVPAVALPAALLAQVRSHLPAASSVRAPAPATPLPPDPVRIAPPPRDLHRFRALQYTNQRGVPR